MKKISIVFMLMLIVGCQKSVQVEVTEQAVTLDAPANLDAAARTQYIAFASHLYFQQQLTNQFEIEQKYAAERETKVALVVTWVGSLFIVCSAFVAVLCLLFKIWVHEERRIVCGVSS